MSGSEIFGGLAGVEGEVGVEVEVEVDGEVGSNFGGFDGDGAGEDSVDCESDKLRDRERGEGTDFTSAEADFPGFKGDRASEGFSFFFFSEGFKVFGVGIGPDGKSATSALEIRNSVIFRFFLVSRISIFKFFSVKFSVSM